MQTDWDQHLAAVEFAYNSSPNIATGEPPFLLATGQLPRSVTSLPHPLHSPNPTAADFISSHHRILQLARRKLQLAQERQVRYANQHRRHTTFRVGDLVLLSTANLPLLNAGTSRKLAPRFVGPFPITKPRPPMFSAHPDLHEVDTILSHHDTLDGAFREGRILAASARVHEGGAGEVRVLVNPTTSESIGVRQGKKQTAKQKRVRRLKRMVVVARQARGEGRRGETRKNGEGEGEWEGKWEGEGAEEDVMEEEGLGEDGGREKERRREMERGREREMGGEEEEEEVEEGGVVHGDGGRHGMGGEKGDRRGGSGVEGRGKGEGAESGRGGDAWEADGSESCGSEGEGVCEGGESEERRDERKGKQGRRRDGRRGEERWMEGRRREGRIEGKEEAWHVACSSPPCFKPSPETASEAPQDLPLHSHVSHNPSLNRHLPRARHCTRVLPHTPLSFRSATHLPLAPPVQYVDMKPLGHTMLAHHPRGADAQGEALPAPFSPTRKVQCGSDDAACASRVEGGAAGDASKVEEVPGQVRRGWGLSCDDSAVVRSGRAKCVVLWRAVGGPSAWCCGAQWEGQVRGAVARSGRAKCVVLWCAVGGPSAWCCGAQWEGQVRGAVVRSGRAKCVVLAPNMEEVPGEGKGRKVRGVMGGERRCKRVVHKVEVLPGTGRERRGVPGGERGKCVMGHRGGARAREAAVGRAAGHRRCTVGAGAVPWHKSRGNPGRECSRASSASSSRAPHLFSTLRIALTLTAPLLPLALHHAL
ncbi:unnamed protein product [Closterium sp. Naga37s-1]|nr:unnamed protein product [Closterium sp. Naga37s-1]